MTHFANILYNSYLSDMHTCLKLMPLPMFRELNLTETGFGLDTQVTAMMLLSGVRPVRGSGELLQPVARAGEEDQLARRGQVPVDPDQDPCCWS